MSTELEIFLVLWTFFNVWSGPKNLWRLRNWQTDKNLDFWKPWMSTELEIFLDIKQILFGWNQIFAMDFWYLLWNFIPHVSLFELKQLLVIQKEAEWKISAESVEIWRQERPIKLAFGVCCRDRNPRPLIVA